MPVCTYLMKMWFFVLLLNVVLVASGDVQRSERKPKLFTFNAVDDDISIDLEFSIPFITIPIRNALNSVGSPSLTLPNVNINPASLLVGGVVVLGTTLVVPLVLKALAAHHPHSRYSRLLEGSEFGADAMLDFATKFFNDGTSIHGCALKIACWTGQSANIDSIRTWHRISSNKLFSTIINSTAVDDAMLSGKGGQDCSMYRPCPLRDEHKNIVLTNFKAIMNKTS